jgi:PadR family transcriptional regulator, regulatory protein PadR
MKSDYLKNWDTQLKKGLLPFYVLSILEKKEYYGYDLIQHLSKEYDIDVTESTMYPLLVRLMKEELLTYKWIEQTSGIPRKYYYISKEGKKCLKEMNKTIQEILNNVKY